MVLALAVGAGMPLLWMWFAPSGKLVAAADVSAGRAKSEKMADGALDGSGPSAAVPVAEPAQPASAAPLLAALTPAQEPAAQPPHAISRVRDPNGDLTPDITDFINNGEVPTMAEVISRLHAVGVRSGLGAFNPPGTRAPLVGIAVSEDFELPPGYVRHHQVTDDGQRIEPILMFSPDHPRVAAGQASTRPQDRVVPPALVPPGLPVRHIAVPPAVGPGNEPKK